MIPYTPLLRVMRWLGKAPMVMVLSKKTLEQDMQQAGFVNITQPTVGAKATTAFMVASTF